MQKYLSRVNIDQDDLKKLNVIHVSGTKGKGSTCAFVERLLIERGYKTGFYSSPHLVVVRERIRINGVPISRKGFTHYFWDVYDTLQSLKADPADMPAYFKFLTIMAFKIFLQENVDVAIMEVGIGGEHDCTNVVENPVVCGISSLDIDHTSILGSTIESIAWHKAGILKAGVPAFTVPQEFDSALPVLLKRAEEKQCSLKIVPPLVRYKSVEKPQLSLSGDIQAMNASLGLQLAHFWLRKKRGEDISSKSDLNCESFPLDAKDLNALKSVVWPGRSQILLDNNITYFLDGAHTCSSMRECVKWYRSIAPRFSSTKSEENFNILIFNVTADRDPETFLQALFPLGFQYAIFTSNLATMDLTASSDQKNFTISQASQMKRCNRMKSIWDGFCLRRETGPSSEDGNITTNNSVDNGNKYCRVFPCISDAVQWFKCVTPDSSHPATLHQATLINVLVTGSLHLVGGFISIVDPTLSSLSQNSQTAQINGKVKTQFKETFIL